MSKKRTIEGRVADAVLQRDITISAGGVTYSVPVPTLGTLALVSEKISELPAFDDGASIQSVLRNAKNGRKIAEVLAIYITGAKAILEDEKTASRGFLARLLRKHHSGRKDALTDEIMMNLTAGDVNSMMTQLIQASDFQDFFDVSTFLRETRLTKPTKVETTASGQS